jgi:aminoglycoside 6'-N-acetyltransferase I
MTIVIKTLGPEDIALVCNAAPGVFDHTPQELLTAEFLSDPRHHLVVAIDTGQVIGFVSAVHYVHPDKPAELWINEIGVAPAHQRRGVGRQMLQAMLSIGRMLGCHNAWVLTDDTNIPARNLYLGAGGVEAPAPSVLFEFQL